MRALSTVFAITIAQIESNDDCLQLIERSALMSGIDRRRETVRSLFFALYHPLAHSPTIFTSDMTTYYCYTLEEALKRAKIAGKRPGCFFGGIILKSGKRGFAIYQEGKVIEQYSVIGYK